MAGSLLLAFLGLAALYAGGEFLVRGASALAARWGVSPLAIGLTVVGFGTSLPELVVSLDATLKGSYDIALGNVVGSNIANIALILGLSALLRPDVVHARVRRVDAPVMVVVSAALLLVLANGTVSRLEAALLVAALVLYIAQTFRSARRESRTVREEFMEVAPELHVGAALAGLMVAAGLVLLVVGGHVLVDAAVQLAQSFGVSEATIGLTIVAVGTSLPELATSVIASVRGRGDIAVGNVVGSNIFNVLGILGTTALIRPVRAGAIGAGDLSVMLGLALALLLLLFLRRRVGRVEGALFVLSYAGYVAWLLLGAGRRFEVG